MPGKLRAPSVMLTVADTSYAASEPCTPKRSPSIAGSEFCGEDDPDELLREGIGAINLAVQVNTFTERIKTLLQIDKPRRKRGKSYRGMVVAAGAKEPEPTSPGALLSTSHRPSMMVNKPSDEEVELRSNLLGLLHDAEDIRKGLQGEILSLQRQLEQRENDMVEALRLTRAERVAAAVDASARICSLRAAWVDPNDRTALLAELERRHIAPPELPATLPDWVPVTWMAIRKGMVLKMLPSGATFAKGENGAVLCTVQKKNEYDILVRYHPYKKGGPPANTEDGQPFPRERTEDRVWVEGPGVPLLCNAEKFPEVVPPLKGDAEGRPPPSPSAASPPASPTGRKVRPGVVRDTESGVWVCTYLMQVIDALVGVHRTELLAVSNRWRQLLSGMRGHVLSIKKEVRALIPWLQKECADLVQQWSAALETGGGIAPQAVVEQKRELQARVISLNEKLREARAKERLTALKLRNALDRRSGVQKEPLPEATPVTLEGDAAEWIAIGGTAEDLEEVREKAAASSEAAAAEPQEQPAAAGLITGISIDVSRNRPGSPAALAREEGPKSNPLALSKAASRLSVLRKDAGRRVSSKKGAGNAEPPPSGGEKQPVPEEADAGLPPAEREAKRRKQEKELQLARMQALEALSPHRDDPPFVPNRKARQAFLEPLKGEINLDDVPWDRIDEWDFDLTLVKTPDGAGGLLWRVGVALFTKYSLWEEFEVDVLNLRSALRDIGKGYQKVPYHCEAHAADVLQSLHAILCKSGAAWHLSNLEILGLLASAAVHDYGHPGINNQFANQVLPGLRRLLGAPSLLEKAHLAMSLHLWMEHDICKGLPDGHLDKLRELMVTNVLGTDMACHFEQLRTWQQEPSMPLFMKLLLYAADFSHPAKPEATYLSWMRRGMVEFFLQGDQQKYRQLPVSPMCDSKTTDVGRCQSGFIGVVILPFFESLNRTVDLSYALPNIEGNRAIWSTPVRAMQEAAMVNAEYREWQAKPKNPAAEFDRRIGVLRHRLVSQIVGERKDQGLETDETTLKDLDDAEQSRRESLFQQSQSMRRSPGGSVRRGSQAALRRGSQAQLSRRGSRFGSSAAAKVKVRSDLDGLAGQMVESDDEEFSPVARLASRRGSLRVAQSPTGGDGSSRGSQPWFGSDGARRKSQRQTKRRATVTAANEESDHSSPNSRRRRSSVPAGGTRRASSISFRKGDPSSPRELSDALRAAGGTPDSSAVAKALAAVTTPPTPALEQPVTPAVEFPPLGPAPEIAFTLPDETSSPRSPMSPSEQVTAQVLTPAAARTQRPRMVDKYVMCGGAWLQMMRTTNAEGTTRLGLVVRESERRVLLVRWLAAAAVRWGGLQAVSNLAAALAEKQAQELAARRRVPMYSVTKIAPYQVAGSDALSNYPVRNVPLTRDRSPVLKDFALYADDDAAPPWPQIRSGPVLPTTPLHSPRSPRHQLSSAAARRLPQLATTGFGAERAASARPADAMGQLPGLQAGPRQSLVGGDVADAMEAAIDRVLALQRLGDGNTADSVEAEMACAFTECFDPIASQIPPDNIAWLAFKGAVADCGDPQAKRLLLNLFAAWLGTRRQGVAAATHAQIEQARNAGPDPRGYSRGTAVSRQTARSQESYVLRPTADPPALPGLSELVPRPTRKSISGAPGSPRAVGGH
eukprot:TRINITY_DN59965_c0_g1_i1.p1 TRINITY_DN59965_c0_g1~~TRINITY_DN59965_c0_g1_i1.p1  ORF type:complete len:1657 (+),score=502.83 TRINITY_DN59965_c0_g1_i1:110-5080(+)